VISAQNQFSNLETNVVGFFLSNPVGVGISISNLAGKIQ
jgi:hypothetical protein